MNVLFVMSDNHCAEFMGAYGGITRTPALDALAERGTLFRSAYCAYPLCGPSRGSLFAGRYAHEIGAWDNAFPWGGTPPGWPAVLRRHGVLLAATGKLHLRKGSELGIEQEFEVGHINPERHVDHFSLMRDQPVDWRAMYPLGWWNAAPREDDAALSAHDARASATTKRAVQWLEDERPAARPWVLYVGYQKPHPPWTPRRELYEHYLKNLPPLAPKYLQPASELHPIDRLQARHTCAYQGGPEDVRRLHARYHGAVEELDEEVGALLAALDRLRLRDQTLVIYAADHGEMARAHGKLSKLSLYEDSVRVPLVVSGPQAPRGVRVDAPVSLLDVFPTIADFLGLPPDPGKRGRSLLPLARGAPDPERTAYAVSEIHGNAWPCAGFALRHGDWKLMEYLGHPPALYHLADDPGEMRDLVRCCGENDPRVRPHLDMLRGLLRDWGDLEEIDRRARADQGEQRRRAERSGLLQKEMRKEAERRAQAESLGFLAPQPEGEIPPC